MSTFWANVTNYFSENFTKLGETIASNLPYFLSFLGIIVGLFVIAFILEKIAQAKTGVKEKVFTTKKVAVIGIMSAISAILMIFGEIPLFFAPGFYKLDFSELPILIATFAYGPATGIMMEFIKIVLKVLFKGTSTAFVGELANFAVGCSFILTASVVYSFKKTKKGAIIATIAGTLALTVFGTAFNAIYLLPAFAKLYGMPLDVILAMGSAINPLAKEGDIVSFVIACVAPLNLIKGISNSVVTLLVYKPLSKFVIKNEPAKKTVKVEK